MKNSLFKRAFAAVATVPLALTQCLSVANAVNVNDTIISSKTAAPAENEYSVDTIRYMDPTEDDGAVYSLLKEVYDENDELASVIYTKKSYWNTSIGMALDAIEGKAPSDTIDLTPAFEEAIARAGKYADIAENIVNKIGNAKYTVNNRTVTVEASLSNITPVFEDFAQSKVGAEFKELSEKYNLDEFKDVKFFDGIEISGDFFVEVETVNGAEDRTFTGKVTFTDETGKVWSNAEVADYFTAKMDELQNSAVAKINELCEKYELTHEELEELVQDSQEYKNIIQNLKDGYTPEKGEIESMIVESIEFHNLVTDYMADYGVDYDVAEEAVKNSDDFADLVERFTNGINLSDEEIKQILQESDDYSNLVNKYMEDNAVSYDEAVDAVLQSAEYQALLDEYTDKYTYTDEEVEAMVKGSADYQHKMSEIKTEYTDLYNRMSSKAESTKSELKGLVNKAKSYMTKGINKYYDMKDYEGSYHFDNYADMANAVNNNQLFNKGMDYVDDKAPDKVTDRLPDSVPEDLDVISQNQMVQNAFIKVINIIGSKVDGITINIAPEDVTELVESITNIDLAAGSSIVTFEGDLPDNEEADAISYVIATYGSDFEGYELVVDGSNSHKEANVEIDFNELDTAATSSVTFELNRVVEIKVKKKELTTTTTATTTTTDDVTTTTTDVVTTTEEDVVTTTTEDDVVTTTAGDVVTTTAGGDVVTTTADDVVTTTAGGDVVTTTAGGDVVTTTAGGDVVTTTAGGDVVTTTAGGDVVTTTAGGDVVTTTAGGDVVTTTAGGDVVTTTAGGDVVTTTAGGDVVTTTAGGDVVTTAGGDVVTTTAGGDVVTTTAGGDVVTTTAGGDVVTTTSGEIEIVGTTTVSAELVSVEVSVESVDGFYLSINKKFNKEQVQSIKYSAVVRHVTTDEADQVVADLSEVVKGEISADQFKFADTPESVFTPVAEGAKASIDNFKYAVALYAAEDIVEDDVTIFAADDAIAGTDGSKATITAYIGVKGDANLSGKTLSDDASIVLAWYATASTGGNEGVAFTTSELAVDPDTSEIIDATLDRFAAFLADTDNENDPDNWKPEVLKTKRQVSASDASFILSAYSLTSTGADATRELWNDVLGETYAKIED